MLHFYSEKIFERTYAYAALIRTVEAQLHFNYMFILPVGIT